MFEHESERDGLLKTGSSSFFRLIPESKEKDHEFDIKCGTSRVRGLSNLIYGWILISQTIIE